MKKQLVHSTVARVFERVVIVVTSLVLTPYFIRVAGQDSYGLWILLLSVLGWFNVLNLGFPSAVQRFVTIAIEKDQPDELNSIFSTGVLLFSAFGMVAVAALLFISSQPQIFNLSASNEVTISVALAFLSVKVFLDFVMNSFHGFFAGYLRFDIDANISTVNAVAKAGLILILLPQFQIYGAVAATILVDVLCNIAKVFYCKRLFPSLRFSLTNASWAEARRLFHFSKHVVASGLVGSLNTNVDAFIITRFLDLSAVAVFAIADRLVAHTRAVIMAFSEVFAPVFTRKFSRGDELGETFETVFRLNLFASLIFLLPLLLAGEPFIVLWVGEDFRIAATLIIWLSVAVIFQAIGLPCRQILMAQANHQWIAPARLISAIINVALSIVLIREYGLVGAVLGTLVGALLAEIIFMLYLLKRHTNSKISTVILPMLLCLVALGTCFYMAPRLISYFGLDTWLDLVLYVSVIAPFTLAISAFTMLRSEDRHHLIIALKESIRQL